jgi:hypothetical protein
MSTVELPPGFAERFSSALRSGVNHIPQLDLTEPERYYLQHQIRYELDEQMMKGLDLFLSKFRARQ